LRIAGKLQFTKAVGWYIDEYKSAQVSINLTNYKVTPPHVAFEEVRKLARQMGLRVTGSEIVGLMPKEALLMAGRYYLKVQGKSQGVPESVLIRTAVQSLGLNDVSPFDPQQKIIEFQVKEFDNSLAELDLRQFADELSSDSPAPGGGSVAALCGVMAASLTAMVANLTYGKHDYERHSRKMNQTAINAQLLKDELLRLVDRDAAAFNAVMSCYRLPRKTEAERAQRQAVIQEATKTAAQIPLHVMETCEKVLALTDYVSKCGNLNSISDAGVAALTADAAIRGAALNVLINLNSIEDAEFKAQMQEAVTQIKAKSRPLIRRIIKRVETKILIRS
jgi:glutamate formiminotransferase/formiminotetrahydrofolate cyclodeaminase